MKLCLNEKIVSSYNSNVTFQKFSMNCMKALICIMMMRKTIGWVVMVKMTVTIHSVMTLLMLLCSCDIKMNVFLQASTVTVL